MKRDAAILGVVAAALAWAGTAGAQQVELGVRAGVSTTTVAWKASPVGTELENVQRRDGVTAGAYLMLGGFGRFFGRAELLLAQKGFSEGREGAISTIAVDYIEVPVLVGLALRDPSERVVPQVFAGPWIAFETRCRAEADTGSISASFDCDEVPGDPVLRRTTDWGVTGGVGVAIGDVGPFRVSLDARYSAGLRNIDAEDAVDNIDAHHRGFVATLGLGIPVGS